MYYNKNLKLKYILASVIFLVSTNMLYAQTATLKGTVLESNSGDELPGASVVLKNENRGMMSREDGSFLFKNLEPGTYTVVITFVGYTKKVRKVELSSSQVTEITITLSQADVNMTGIVVRSLRPDLQTQSQIGNRQIREETPNDTGGLLRSVTGVDAVRRGPIGLDPVIRGLRETEVGTYQDGTRVFPAGPARMDSPLSHIDPSSIESIEVVKGPYALAWGAGNLSAIRVTTQDMTLVPDKTFNGQAGFGYQSNLGILENTASVTGRSGRVAASVNAAWREGNDYKAGSNAQIPADFLSREIRTKVSYKTGDSSYLTGSFGFQDQEDINYPGRLLNAQSFDSYNAKLDWEKSSTTGYLRNIKINGYYNGVDHIMSNDGKPTAQAVPGRVPPFALDIKVDSEIDIIGGQVMFDLVPAADWNIKTGADIYSANRDAVRFVRRAENQMLIFEDQMWPDATTINLGTYIQAEHHMNEVLTGTGTARIDWVSNDADRASDFFLDNVSNDLDDTEVNLSAAYSLSATLNDHLMLSIGAGTAVRTADVNERYSDRIPASKSQTSAEFVGNTALDPERSSQIDIWLETMYPRFSFNANLFIRRINDYITLTPTNLPKRLPLSPETVFQYENGKADFWGSEASLGYQFIPSLRTEASIGYIWAKEKTINEPVLGIAPFRFDLKLRYEPVSARSIYAELITEVVDRQNRVATTRGERPTDGYQTVDFRAGAEVFNGVMLRFGIENMFDAQYVNHLNANNPFAGIPIAAFSGLRIPEPGRIFKIDLDIQF